MGWKACLQQRWERSGEVTVLTNSADNKATELRADIGSATGSGKHPIILPATRFSLEGDRVIIDMKAVQATKLPKMNY